VKQNTSSPRSVWNRWLLQNLGGAIADRLDQLEQQLQAYQQENQDLKQKLKAEQNQVQQLKEQVDRVERCVRLAIEPTEIGADLGQVDRQFTRLWQYYQDTKVQFEQINRQLQTQRTTSETTYQTLRKHFNKLHGKHQAEIRDLKQQFDQALFSLQPNRSSPDDVQ
jgi:predicted RNase H-like nuclease (RuvC/YqgF family)